MVLKVQWLGRLYGCNWLWLQLRSLLDCPVPHLTLLFFGATKDIPEAAKMVTAGTACLHGPAFKPCYDL